MALYRIDFRGTLHGAETFQHGHHVSSADSAAGIASDAAAQWLAILAVGTFSALFTTGVQWVDVNVSELGPTPGSPVVTSSIAAIADGGTSVAGALPNQCSTVVSLTSATAGSRARGRMYLPPMDSAVLTTAGRLGVAPTSNCADAIEDYFDQMSAAGHSHVVVSSVGGVYTTYPLVSIRVGNVIDTQRSRRNDLAEVYQVRTV